MRLQHTFQLIAFAILTACGGGGGGSDRDVTPPASGTGPGTAPASSPTSLTAAEYLAPLSDGPFQVKFVRELGEEKAATLLDRSTGESIEIFGPKDEKGHLVGLGKTVQTSKDGTRTTVEYLQSGAKTITYAERTRVDLVAQPDGRWQVEFTDTRTGESFETLLPAVPNPTVRAAPTAASLSGEPAGSSVNKILVNIRTTNCGVPGDPGGGRVFVNFNDGFGKNIGTYSASRTDTGLYHAEIPNPNNEAPLTLAFVKESLDSLNTVLEAACSAKELSPPLAAEQSCLYISGLMASTGVGLAVAPEFLAACEAAVAGLEITCKIKASITPLQNPPVELTGQDVIPSVEAVLIDLIPDSVAAPQVVAFAEGLPSNVFGPPAEVSNPASEVNLALDDDHPFVGSIVINPTNPAAEAPYTATAELRCVPFGSALLLTASGTDGFQASNSAQFTNNVQSTAIALNAPGVTNAPCTVPSFAGASSPAGASATMTVLNSAITCGVTLFGVSSPTFQHPATGGLITRPPQHGTVTIEAPRFVYHPDPTYAGTDAFGVQMFSTDLNGQAVTLTVNTNVNVLPGRASGTRDTISLRFSLPDGSVISKDAVVVLQ
jgi:hypothetical protein